MFLNLLTAEQQIAFARAAVFAVHADGDVDKREATLLDELREEMGLPELPPVPPVELVESDLVVFDDPVSRRILLLELAGIVTADGHRHSDEMGPLYDWAGRLGLGRSVVDEFLDFADRAHAVYRDGRSLVLSDEAT